MKYDDATWSLEELCARVELPKRTVRYYIQQGLVDRPTGAAKAARYGERHLTQLLEIRKWQRAGLSLARIAEVMREREAGSLPERRRGRGSVEVWSRLVIDDGVELHLEPARAGLAPEAVRAFLRRVIAAYDDIREEHDHD
jgi:DNA-binding transcriptional MerR regulator